MDASRNGHAGLGMERRSDVRARINILIAVAVRLYRDGLAAALSANDGLRILATAGTSAEIQAAALADQPDVVIIDVALDEVLALMRALRAQCDRIRILAFAVGSEMDTIVDYAKAGADGFFNANGSLAELVEAIERTAAGELLCSPRVAAELLRQAARRSSAPASHDAEQTLTKRESQVLILLKQGRSNKEIAIALHISEATVKNHVHHVLQKMHVARRGEAIARGAHAEILLADAPSFSAHDVVRLT
jgi:two-component system nitrate/nitrite response regulator NarL